MTKFSDEDLVIFWRLTRAGNRRPALMQYFNISKEDCDAMYSEAQRLFGRGPQKTKHIDNYQPDPPKKTFTRPPAVYSNTDWEKRRQELLNQ